MRGSSASRRPSPSRFTASTVSDRNAAGKNTMNGFTCHSARPSAMITEAILSFIGAGTPPIIPSWGNIMAEGRALWQVKPYIVFFPAVFLSLTVLAVNLLGDGLRDALDPRMATRL